MKKWAIGCLLVLLAACGDDSNSVDTTPDQGSGDMAVVDMGADAEAVDPFEVWREMRETLRDDPGYLRYERDRLVEAGDPAAMHLFVRDRIRAVPSRLGSWGPTNELLYGARATLRYGEGSRRDKAELLVEMLTEAGFEAEVRQIINAPEDFTEVVLRPREHVEPTIAEEQIAEWDSKLDVPDSPIVVDPDGTQARALAEQIVDAMPPDTDNFEYDPSAVGQIPIVRFRASADEEWTIANLFMPGVELGESPTGASTSGAFRLTEPPPVEIELRLHSSAGPEAGEVIVGGTFPQTVLAGRQLLVSAAPAGELEDTLLQPIDHFTTFIPVLSLQGIDLDDETRDEYTFVGEAFTLRGNRITVDESGNITVDGQVLAAPQETDLSTIDAVEAAAEGARFPEVTLRVDVTSDGTDVERLPASAFEIEDNGQQVAPVLLANEKRPRILIITDRSTSLPEEFRTSAFTDVVVDLASTVQGANPRAEFMNLQVGEDVDPAGWSSDLSVLESRLNDTRVEGSTLWSALAVASRAQPTTCVMITDGEAIDMPTDERLALIDLMPPCVFLRAGGDPETSVLPELAELVGGEVYEVSDVNAARDRILEFVSELTQTYRLRYSARDRSPGEHTVDIKVGEVEATATYEAPEAGDPGQIWGLQIVMTQGRVREPVRRMLVGDYFGEPLSIEEAQRQLVSTRVIAFEGPSPIPHEIYDELLDNRLNSEPLVRAVESGDEEEMLTQLAQGRRHMPGELLAVMSSERNDQTIFKDGIQAYMSEQKLVDSRTKVAALDIISGPSFGSRVVSENSLVDTIAATLRASLIEDLLYETSAISQLEGEELAYMSRTSELETVLSELSPEEQQRWRVALTPYRGMHLVVPADGEPIAFYAVDKLTGHTTAVLDDSSGGGRTATELRAQLAQVEAFLDWLGFGGSAASASVGFGVWIAFSKAYAKNILIATIAIVEMSSPITDLPGDAGGVGCTWIEGELINSVPGPAKYYIGVINSFSSAAGGRSLLGC